MEWEKKFDSLSLSRGKNLFHSGRVANVRRSETEITACVTGAPRYDVTIGLRDNVPVRMKCQCPKFRGRGNCEHLAAVLYAVFGNAERAGDKASDARQRAELEKKAAIIAAAKEAAEKEAAAKAAAQKKTAEKEAEEAAARQEVQLRIAQREAEKRARKAERKSRRLEAQEAQHRAQQEAKRLQQEEERRRQEEAAEKIAAEAEKKAREEEKRKAMEEEAARRREEKIQAAIARKANQDRNVPDAEKSGQTESDRTESDGYRYFDFGKLRKALRLSAISMRQGAVLRQNNAIANIKVASGYVDSTREMAIEISAVGKVRKKEFPVRLVFTRDKILHVGCSCPDCVDQYLIWYNQYRDCAWVSGVFDIAETYILKHGIGDATDRTAGWVLHAFAQKRANQIMAQTEAQAESLQLVPRLQERDDVLRLSFRVGGTRLFVVKDLFEFCSHVKNSETATYGSSTEINHRLENFTKGGREWFGFINKVIQEEERLEQRLEESLRYSYRGSRLNALELYGWRLDQFFDILGDRPVEFERKTFQKKEKSALTCREENPEIVMQIQKNRIGGKKEFHGISVFCQMPSFFYGVDSAYYIGKDGLCRVKKEFMQKIQALADAAQDGSLEFQVGRRQLPEFYYTVLPALGECVKVQEENAEEIHSYLPPEVRFIFYLDAENGNLTCRSHACYGDREVSLLDYLDHNDNIVIQPFRIKSQEQEVLYQVLQLFPEADPARDVLHCMEDEDLIYQVLEHGVDELMELGEVQCTKRFRNMNLIRCVKVSVGVSVSEGLLNLDIGTEDISRQELLDILKCYRTRRKYYRLKNGDFLNLDDNSLQMLSELMETMHLSPKEFVKGKMHLPAYRALYMDKLLEENENIYNTRDSHFKALVKNFKTISDADFEEPPSLARVLRGYQKNGFKWFKTLESYGFGGILADDMGLGKTLQMIAVLLDAKQNGQQGTSLIVSPASLVYNWEEELHRFAPQLSVIPITGGQEARREKLANSEKYDVLITSYDLLKRDVDQYEGKHFLYEVIDEAQYIKNHTTAAAKAVKVIQSRNKFALTGTPIENRLSELWSIFDYLMPGFLYGYDVFKREMETPIVKSGDENAVKRLQKMTGPFILRRLKQDVLKDLPDKLEEVRYVQLENDQRKAYDAQVVHMQEQLRKQDSEDFNKSRMQILAELTRLRQICCDPSLCFENYRGESAKLESCMELIESAIDGGHKILLFSQFTAMLEILQERLEQMGIPFFTITGATDKEKRLQMVKAFNGDDTPVFLISLKAGGVGLNLTGADVVIHYDPWWNLAAQDQATDRAHRIGQTKKVTVYKLIARQTVEEKILALQETKRDLADSIVNAQAGQLAGMSREEILALLEA